MAISRSKLVALLGVIAAVTSGWARRGGHTLVQPIDGVRFSARARLVGALRDTVVVRIRARNAGRETRRLTWTAGGDELTLRVAPLGGGFAHRVVWDSEKRARADAEARVRDGTMAKGVPNVRSGPAIAVLRTVAPGDSVDVASMTIPVRSILGDSLRSRWYRLTARGNGNVWQAGELHAADLELRVPRN